MPKSSQIILLVFLVISNHIYAQIDSLKQAREIAKHDSLIIRTDLKLGRAYEETDFDSALYFYNRALSKAQDLTFYDKHPFFKGLVLEYIGFAYIYGKGQVSLGRAYLKRALSSHLKGGLLSEANKTEYNLGFFYYSNYDSAIYHYNRVINRHKDTERMDRLHESYNNAGLNYYYKGEYALSADYLIKAIRLKEETGETREIQHTFGNLGIVFLNLGEYERAKFYYRKSNLIMENMQSNAGIATNLRNIGDVLVLQDSIEEGLNYYERARGLSQETGDLTGLSQYHNSLAQVYENSKDYSKALLNYQLAFDEFPSKMNDRYSSSLKASLGRVKLKLLDQNREISKQRRGQIIQEVLVLGIESWEHAVRSELLERKLSSAKLLRSVYQENGDYDKALAFADSALRLTDVINNRAKSQAIAFAATEYETERVENENILLEEKQQVQNAQLEQQRYLLIASIVVLILLIIITALIQNGRIKLRKANERIEKSLSEKELLLKEIHHRVKNNLQVVSSLLDLQSRGIEDEGALATFMEGQNRVKAMALIHQKLYQNEDLATIDFKEYAENLIKELSSIYSSDKNVSTAVETKGSSDFDIDTAVPLGLILNELISNAYKYAFEDNNVGEIKVKVEDLGEGKHQLTVSDSGIGLPEGFDFTKAKSLGLRLVRRLAKQLYGNVAYTRGQGSEFVITFTNSIQRKVA